MVIGKFWRSATALAAASILLAGSGAEESGGEALTRAEVNAVLPDSDAMSGWKSSGSRWTTTSKDAYESKVCPGEMAEACAGVRSYGSSQYRLGKELLSSFQVITYEDGGSAEAAYGALWKRNGVIADPHDLDFNDLGEESDARGGKAGYEGEGGAVYQVRVGPLVLFGTAKSLTPEVELGEATVEELASMFAERAEQAVSGEDPSAGLAGR